VSAPAIERRGRRAVNVRDRAYQPLVCAVCESRGLFQPTLVRFQDSDEHIKVTADVEQPFGGQDMDFTQLPRELLARRIANQDWYKALLSFRDFI
jgi:hypothetical protein